MLDRATIAQLRQWQRRTPSRGHRLAWWVVAVVLLLHLLFAALTLLALRPPMPRGARQAAAVGEVLEVRFLPAHAPLTKPPPPAPPLPPPRPRHVSVAQGTQAAALPAPAASVAPPRLFDGNGQVILPAAPPAPAPVPRYVQRLPQGDTRIMRHDSPVKYQATRFEKDWGHGNSAVDDLLQKAVDKTTVKHTFHLPRGIHIHCGISLAALAGGCGGDPPPPPPPKDGDVRLNMAPARPLAADPHAPPPPPLSECIALYRAGKPLAAGCPSDTPLRAIDQELREQRAKQAAQP